jgi:D-3-phosphoglycerate dehydrogenase
MDKLRQSFDVIVPPDVKDSTLVRLGSEAEALVVRLTPVTGELISSLPRLKVIGRNGVGVDNIDVEAATARGVAVVNAPGFNTRAVAEYTIGAMIMLTRSLLVLNNETKKGNYQVRDLIRGRELGGKSVGIVGFGNIGRTVAGMAAALGMEVMFYDPYAGEVENIRKCEIISELLGRADFVSINLPLTSETRNMIGRAELGMMREDAFLINSSRGEVIDENALYEALAAKKIAGAALDVFSTEPFPRNSPFYELENVIITPHVAGMTDDCMKKMSLSLAGDIAGVLLEGTKPRNLVNREIWPE